MRIGIYGYGNLGKGVECAIKYQNDMQLVGVFTRRPPESVKTLTDIPVYPAEEILNFKNEIDVLILCGGSATDLPATTPELANHFNVVDSFDTHAKIPDHYTNVDKTAKESKHIALISCGWDPGLFSISRVYSSAVLPNGTDYTFWGRGISQGHSDAIRRIEGVLDAKQYTIPVPEAIDAVKSGKTPKLTTREKHKRECFVVLKDGADAMAVEKAIKTMPNYFTDYDTTVNFISLDELKKKHSGMPHGGAVIRNGKTGLSGENTHTIEFSLKLDSNPEFTASVLVCYARAIKRMYDRGIYGCKTVFDIAPGDLSPLSPEELRQLML